MKTLVIEKKARQKLQNMPRNTAKRIRQKMDVYFADPQSNQHMVKHIINMDKSRLRIGDWRVFFKETDDYFYVSDILPRGSAYKR